MLRSSVQQYIMKSGGQSDDAEQIYSELIIQCVKTMFSRKEFDQDGPLDAYLMGIAKYLWLAELKRKKSAGHIDEIQDSSMPDIQASTEQIFLNSERRDLLNDLLMKLRGNCQEVLMHWANGYNMEEIAQKLNYQSEGMARKKKSQCLKELLEYIACHPHIKKLLWN
ncbi:MAG: sigma-70 family RNA polymerase sigma factor [Saprospiraceae bacterium]